MIAKSNEPNYFLSLRFQEILSPEKESMPRGKWFLYDHLPFVKENLIQKSKT